MNEKLFHGAILISVKTTKFTLLTDNSTTRMEPMEAVESLRWVLATHTSLVYISVSDKIHALVLDKCEIEMYTKTD